MQKTISTLIISLLLCGVAYSKQKSYNIGEGSVTLSNQVVQNFIKYIKKSLKGKTGDEPITFWITKDGINSYWWTSDGNSCTRTWDNEIYIVGRTGIITYGIADVCRGREHIAKFADQCEAYFKQECKIFARQRIIIWDNGVNPGKGKKSKINSRWSDQQIVSKLTELDFIGSNQSKKETKSIGTDTSKNNTEDDILTQLKELKSLYDDGVLTKEEYLKAQETLLN